MSRAARVVRAAGWVAVLATPLAAQQPAATRAARITYITGSSVYLDAGKLEGLREGARVEVTRGGGAIAVLRVAFLASHQASCEIVSAAVQPVVGDSVRFVPAAPEPAPAAAAARPARPTPERRTTSRSVAGLRGRIGAHYLVVRQLAGTGGILSQPSLDARLDGRLLPGAPVGVLLDVRSRRTTSTLADDGGVERTRAYQAALYWQSARFPTRITVGRQLSGHLAGVGLFDGLLAEIGGQHWSGGFFAGSQPEPVHLGFSSDVIEAGAFLRRHSRAGAGPYWSMTLGAAGSYQDAHANREYAFVQATYAGNRMTAALTQEVDYYRPWKLTGDMRPVSPTGTYTMVRYRATGAVTVHAGFDSRRTVRLYRDVLNPETTFDDAYRQGVWAGAWMQIRRRQRVSVDVRSSTGGPAGRALSYTAALDANGISALGATARVRSTRYTNPMLSGWLHSASVGVSPPGPFHVELSGGLRAEHNSAADPPDFSVSWVGVDVDVSLAGAWYAMLAYNREVGGLESNDRLYSGVSVRF